jgi:hypothetical protein
MRLLGTREEPPASRIVSGKGLKAGVITLVGFAGLTAASGAVSSLRRRKARKARDDS